MAGHERKKHLIDGKEMTAPEIAAMLGISEQALRFRHSQMNLCSYQLIVDMYREGKMMTNHDRWPRHLVHGRWITVQQAADELGVRAHSINTWRCKNRDMDGNRPTLEEAYEHFRNAPKRGRGNAIPKVHTVMGRKMTVKQAASGKDQYYDLQGRKVTVTNQSAPALRKGIYIKNGKKYYLSPLK